MLTFKIRNQSLILKGENKNGIGEKTTKVTEMSPYF